MEKDFHYYLTLAAATLTKLPQPDIWAVEAYDAVATLFCAVVVLTGGLAVHLVTIALRLRTRIASAGAGVRGE
jgi:hypothetical protein